MTCFNIPCKFSKGAKVKVVSGFLKGEKGKISDAYGNRKPLGLQGPEFDEVEFESSYRIKTGFFREEIYAYESQLEEL